MWKERLRKYGSWCLCALYVGFLALALTYRKQILPNMDVGDFLALVGGVSTLAALMISAIAMLIADKAKKNAIPLLIVMVMGGLVTGILGVIMIMQSLYPMPPFKLDPIVGYAGPAVVFFALTAYDIFSVLRKKHEASCANVARSPVRHEITLFACDLPIILGVLIVFLVALLHLRTDWDRLPLFLGSAIILENTFYFASFASVYSKSWDGSGR